MYKAVYNNFKKYLDCTYLYSDTDGIIVNIIVPGVSSFEKKIEKVSGILSNSEIVKLKKEILNDTNKEAGFLKLKHIAILAKRKEEKNLKGITRSTVKKQIDIEDYKTAIFDSKSEYVTNCSIEITNHYIKT